MKRVIEGRVTTAISIKEIVFRGEHLRINVANTREAAAASARRSGSNTLFDSFGALGKTILIADNAQAGLIAAFFGLTSENILNDSERFGFLRSAKTNQTCYAVPSQAANLFHQVSGISDTPVELPILEAVNQ
ncbi:hypothetical protein HGA34_00500 [Candidatus Falkowbacteria bacterium]|nr:hypothetical protein [Candidatus Falkowbacteria bacterium]